MNKTLSEYLQTIPDFRSQNKNFRYKLSDILFLAISATLHGAEDFEEIALFGEEQVEFLREFLDLEHGIPSHDTIRRVFIYLDADAFNTCFMNWIAATLSSLGLAYNQISIDGKHLRGTKTSLDLVSAVASELGISLGHVKTDDKSNEIKAIPELLELLHLQGCIVSIDAMGTQREIAKKIIEKGGDYFLALKGNQPQLLAQVKQTFELQNLKDIFEDNDWTYSHNEIVRYKVKVSNNLKWTVRRCDRK